MRLEKQVEKNTGLKVVSLGASKDIIELCLSDGVHWFKSSYAKELFFRPNKAFWKFIKADFAAGIRNL